MLAVGAMPRLPASAAARSLSMSACRLVATIVSSDAGRLTMRAVAASTSSLSQVTSGNSCGNLGRNLVPHHHGVALRIALGDHGQQLARPRLRQSEGEALDALDPRARHHRQVRRYLDRVALMHPAADAGIFALGVFAHDHPVQVFRFAALQRCIDPGKNARRAHIGVLIEALADLEPQTPQRDVVGNVWVAGRPKENGVLAAQSYRVRSPASSRHAGGSSLHPSRSSRIRK